MTKVKLKIPKVVNGGVWAAGSVVEVNDYEAKKMIEAGEAEAVAPSHPVAKSVSREAKDEK